MISRLIKKEYIPWVRWLARRYSSHREDISYDYDDLIQLAAIVIHKYEPLFNPDGNRKIKSWLLPKVSTAMRNHVYAYRLPVKMNYKQKERFSESYREVPEEASSIENVSPDPLTMLLRKEDSHRIRTAASGTRKLILSEMPVEERKCALSVLSREEIRGNELAYLKKGRYLRARRRHLERINLP